MSNKKEVSFIILATLKIHSEKGNTKLRDPNPLFKIPNMPFI
jgi:hypothetical protein